MSSTCQSFPFLFYLFHILVWVAIALVTFLFATYQKSGQNVLLRSLCCVLLVSLLMIEGGYIFMGVEPYNHESYQDFSIIQAIVLNYCFISAQAHSACMMVNNCLLAMGWRFGEWEKLMDRSLLFLFLSYGLPIIPTFILGVMIPEYARHITFPFYAFVPANLMFSCCALWLLICAIPGSIAAVYLIFQTIRLRRQTVEMTAHTQISYLQLSRLFVAVVIYLFISLFSAIPLLLVDPELYKQPDNFLGSAQLKSPWTNVQLCCPPPGEDERLLYYTRVRCPGMISYMPALMALGVFLMYGFGTPVRAAFRQISIMTNKILHRPKRRMSSVVMDMSEETEDEYEIQVGGSPRLPALEEEDEEAEPEPVVTPRKKGLNQRRRGSPTL